MQTPPLEPDENYTFAALNTLCMFCGYSQHRSTCPAARNVICKNCAKKVDSGSTNNFIDTCLVKENRCSIRITKSRITMGSIAHSSNEVGSCSIQNKCVTLLSFTDLINLRNFTAILSSRLHNVVRYPGVWFPGRYNPKQCRSLSGSCVLQHSKNEIDSFLQQGIIRLSSSCWATALHIVPKNNVGVHPCGDYKALNAQLVIDRYNVHVLTDHKPLTTAFLNYKSTNSPIYTTTSPGVSIEIYYRYCQIEVEDKLPADVLSRNGKSLFSAPLIEYAAIASSKSSCPELLQLIANPSIKLKKITVVHGLSYPIIRATQQLLTSPLIWHSLKKDKVAGESIDGWISRFRSPPIIPSDIGKSFLILPIEHYVCTFPKRNTICLLRALTFQHILDILHSAHPPFELDIPWKKTLVYPPYNWYMVQHSVFPDNSLEKLLRWTPLLFKTEKKTINVNIAEKTFFSYLICDNIYALTLAVKISGVTIVLRHFDKNPILLQHMRMHTGDKKYICEICQRKFTQLSHLQQHIRTHTGDKPYKCQYNGCLKAFSQLSNLQSHSKMPSIR
ncbi:ZNF362_384 [Lepeophtheirus salmonis]|uniref:ZNF362_384 n=1 Tax=Lepeophtheirus salmonis TaxID=72036 RepID=A0A7R8CGA9_LEPSM|nr:ZNF362_384 [Lepeophtheirus salmonis]CAF2814753.1 ZNF362_384 [Lepeophtheirus salmonis]